METVKAAAEQLTWDKLWLYTVLVLIIFAMVKGSKFIDHRLELMRAEHDKNLEEAKLARLRFDIEADAAAKANRL